MTPDQLSQFLQLIKTEDTAGGVARRIDHQQTGSRSDRCLERLQIQAETVARR
ncbi:MAG: Uncharacterised protein [Cyanobium sp. ARS6]|nr:MAG: Uncharacterised protein [Cyanobium sp. ARS6]